MYYFHPQQVQQGGVEVRHTDTVLDRLVPQFIGGPVDAARLDAPSGQPDREASRVVVTTRRRQVSSVG